MLVNCSVVGDGGPTLRARIGGPVALACASGSDPVAGGGFGWRGSGGQETPEAGRTTARVGGCWRHPGATRPGSALRRSRSGRAGTSCETLIPRSLDPSIPHNVAAGTWTTICADVEALCHSFEQCRSRWVPCPSCKRGHVPHLTIPDARSLPMACPRPQRGLGHGTRTSNG